MTLKPSTFAWTTYEEQVFELLRQQYPSATVQKNVKVKGRFSKRVRQIDILVLEATPAGTLKTVVDTKFFKRRIDVKAVDSLAGFVDDVDAQRGMLVTNKGYTKAALSRAFYGPRDLELDILNFSDLQRFQGFTAIPYKGDKAFLVRAPLGWIIDATRSEGRLTNMYQRGITLKEAMARKEFLYINYWDRRADPLTADELDQQQVAQMRIFGQVTVSHRETIKRPDAVTLLRIGEVKRYKCLEVTGFLEFDKVIFFAVLLTPTETQRSNIRRLESVMKTAVPIEFRRDNNALIARIQEQLNGNVIPIERARLLREKGHWYRDMDQLQEARACLEESLALDPSGPGGYWTISELLPVLVGLRDKGRAIEVMSHLLRLDPMNPTVFNDCFKFAAGWIERVDMLQVIEALKSEHGDNTLIQANCDFYAGNILSIDDPSLAKRRFAAARNVLRQHFPKKHQVFRAISLALKQLRRAGDPLKSAFRLTEDGKEPGGPS